MRGQLTMNEKKGLIVKALVTFSFISFPIQIWQSFHFESFSQLIQQTTTSTEIIIIIELLNYYYLANVHYLFDTRWPFCPCCRSGPDYYYYSI